MTPEPALWVAVGLGLAAAATVAYWRARFQELGGGPALRLAGQSPHAVAPPPAPVAPAAPGAVETALAAERVSRTARFALELLGSHRLPSDPASLAEILRQGADRLLARSPDLSLGVWKREGTAAELVLRTGELAGAPEERLSVPERDWDSCAEIPQGLEWRGSVSLLNPGLAGLGFGAARLLAWGDRLGVHGLLLACEADPAGPALETARPELDLLAAHFTSVAGMAGRLWELRRSQERLEGGLSTLHEVAETILGRPDRPSDSLGAIVAIVAKAMRADLCAFLLYDEKTEELVTQAGGYGLSGDEGSLYRLSVRNETASSVRVFRSGRPFITGDAQNDPQVISRYAKLWKCHSLMVAPLTLKGRRLGVLRVGSFQRDFFNQDHLRFIELIAEEAVVLIESAMLTRKLEETNERLAEINRIKDEFVSTVSHEFKTPLTSIKGFTAVMLEGASGPLTVEQKRFLAIIQSACDRLNSLVGDLLDIARLESGARMEFGPVALEELFQHCREVHQWHAESKSIALGADLPAGLPPARGDARWLRQVLDNLVSNALKFTPAGGSVAVSAAQRGEALELTVADTGMGIDPEDQPHIFEKFYRARNRDVLNTPGTGLGLAIAKSVVEKHDGKLWFESEAGKGSTFHLLLPAASATEEPVAAKAGHQGGP